MESAGLVDDRPRGSCPTCRRRDPHVGRVCEPCRAWYPIALSSIAEKYGDALAILDLVLEPDDRTTVNGRPHHDPIAASPRLTAGPAASESLEPRVSGSRYPAAPLDLDLHDLLGDVVRDGGRPIDATGDNWVSVASGAKPRRVWAGYGWRYVGRQVMVPAGDQVGVVPVAQVLDQELRAWVDAGAPGARFRPVPSVGVMVNWLGVRLPWAFEYYEPIDVFAGTVANVRGRLMAALGEFDPEPEPCVGAACKRCDKRMLFRRQDGSGDVECKNPDCMKIYGAEEYADWSRHLGAYESSQRSPEEVRELLFGRGVQVGCAA